MGSDTELPEYVRRRAEELLRTRLAAGVDLARLACLEWEQAHPDTTLASGIPEEHRPHYTSHPHEDVADLLGMVHALQAMLAVVERDEPDMAAVFREGWKAGLAKARKVIEEYVPDANQFAGAMQQLEAEADER